MSEVGEIRLSKHHGAGNDFLVFMDMADRRPFSAIEVRAMCDRHFGVGADGIVRVLAGGSGAALSMELRNADGSFAEMSGNGIRCLAQAAIEAGVVAAGVVTVETVVGVRNVDYETVGPGLGRAAVDMGPAILGSELAIDDLAVDATVAVHKARSVDMGNPHIVLMCDRASDEVVSTVGACLARSVPEGANVEFAWRDTGPEALDVRVFERGVGETLACGTGAAAAVAAAHAWEMVGDRVEVHLPGGMLEVEVRRDSIVLRGPTRKVAEVMIRESNLVELVGEMLARQTPRKSTGVSSETVGRQ
jgi:diaminopimelate epimerase